MRHIKNESIIQKKVLFKKSIIQNMYYSKYVLFKKSIINSKCFKAIKVDEALYK